MPDAAPEVLWRPPEDVRETSIIGCYLGWLEQNRELRFSSYKELWEWSVSDLEGFWSSIWKFFEVDGTGYERVLSGREMPGVRWFEGATLNYAQHALRTTGDRVMVSSLSQTTSTPRGEKGRSSSGISAEHLRSSRSFACKCQPRSGVVLLRAGVRDQKRGRPLRPDRPQGASRDRRLLLRSKAHRAQQRGRRDTRGFARTPVNRRRSLLQKRFDSRLGHLGRIVIRAGLAELRQSAVRSPALRPLLVGHNRPAQADRSRPRWHPARAPQSTGTARGPRALGSLSVVLDHRLDDVELLRLGPAGLVLGCVLRRQPRPPGPHGLVAGGRGAGRHLFRLQRALPARVPQGRNRTGGRARPVAAALRGIDRSAPAP